MTFKYSRFLFFIVLFFSPSLALSNPHRYIIDSAQSYIRCSVNYLVVPKIKGEFKDFSGIIYYDPLGKMESSSVLLKVKTASVDTGNDAWNKVIRSRKVLDPQQYPQMIFQSSVVSGTKEEGHIKGTVDLHGIKKDMSFFFTISQPEEGSREDRLIAKGKWVIDRKDFNIIWHAWLDKGGVIVGNKVLIEWEVVARRDR